METTAKVGQEQMRAEIETGLKEMKVNQERTEAVSENCEGAPGVNATQVITTVQSKVSDIVRGVPKGLTDAAEMQQRRKRTRNTTAGISIKRENCNEAFR
jgi:hypothetical protein